MKTFESIKQKLINQKTSFDEITFIDEAISARETDNSVDKNYNPDNAIKTLIISTKEGHKALILKGSDRVDEEKLKKILRKWSVINSTVLKEKFGFLPGCVFPLDLDLPFFIDKKVENLDVWSMGAGDPKKGFNIKKEVAFSFIKNFHIVSLTHMEKINIEERLKLIKEVGEEIIQEEELKKLLESGEKLIAYDGFEPSGQIHIAQGIVRAINVNKMIKAGVKFRMWVADWHAMANNKMGGDLEKIKIVGKYFIEVWRACGMDLSKVEFLWASDMAKNPDYWKLVVQVGKSNALKRFIRTAEMMGREESLDKLTGAHIIYSCMQVADIFMLGAKITQLGMDQRKVNMLAREVGPMLGYWKPVVVSHHMLMGLSKAPTHTFNASSERSAKLIGEAPKEGAIQRTIERKMSKSMPDSAIFMTDTTEDIKRKINKAYCLEGDIKENPILEYYKYIVFDSFDKLNISEVKIERPEKFGGNISFKTYKDLEKTFAEKKVHPMDLKTVLIKYLDQLIDPVRCHFEENAEAKKLLEQVRNFQVTR